MSLTPEEIALCRDALFEAGVPTKIVESLVGLHERVRVIYGSELVAYHQAGDRRLKEAAWASLWRSVAAECNNNDFGWKTMISTPDLDAVQYGLKLYVLTPPEWTPPAKVQR